MCWCCQEALLRRCVACFRLTPTDLCAAPIEVLVEHAPGAKSLLAIDDGVCDAFRFSIAGSPARLLFARN